MKCSKRISRWGSLNERFLMVWMCFSGIKNENTCEAKMKSCEKSIVTGADTCITESSEIEQLSDFSECFVCSVFAFSTACWRVCDAENVLPNTVNISISDIKKTLKRRDMCEVFCIVKNKSSTFFRGMPNSVPIFFEDSFFKWEYYEPKMKLFLV